MAVYVVGTDAVQRYLTGLGDPDPHTTGHLRLTIEEAAPVVPADLATRLEAAFARGDGRGLLQLGAAEPDTPLPAVFAYWRELGSRYVHAVCGQQALNSGRA